MKFVSALLLSLCLPLTALAEEGTSLVTSSILSVAALLLVAALMCFISAKKKKWNAGMLAKAALTAALCYLLSLITIFRMPMGGSVTLVSTMPLVLFTLALGPVNGAIAGFAYGLLSLIMNPYVIHPVQLLVDYPLAYGAAALCYLASPVKNTRVRFVLAALLAYTGRLIMSTLSGVIFFSEYAGEQNAFIYSVVYNLSYLGPEALLCVAILQIPGMERLVKVIRGERRFK